MGKEGDKAGEGRRRPGHGWLERREHEEKDVCPLRWLGGAAAWRARALARAPLKKKGLASGARQSVTGGEAARDELVRSDPGGERVRSAEQ